MDARRLFVATIAEDAPALASAYGVGLELDEFCTAANMDGAAFKHWDTVARAHLRAADRHLLHLPFAEIYPAAIDPRARALAMERLRQGVALAQRYNIRRAVAHAGFVPSVYDKGWFVERSISFWKEFLSTLPDNFTILLENVLEDDPALIANVLRGVDDARLRACFDVGHAFVYSRIAPEQWIDALSPWLVHAHLSNNRGDRDTHGGLDDGDMDMDALIACLLRASPDITLTLETQRAQPSLERLLGKPPVMQPDDAPSTDDPARALLKRIYGYDDFRPGQRALIDAILGGRDVLGVMPTGAGKSICFQLPALMMDGLTLVISPLISLMKDQVGALVQSGVPAAYLNSSLTERQFERALQNAAQGRYKIIYIAPERLLTSRFAAFAASVRIAMVAVDEAHCISQWGQDFRPGYLDIPSFISALAHRPPVCAFTATATEQVRKDILRLLALQNPYCLQTGFDRPNLYFEVRPTRFKPGVLQALLAQRAKQSGIVYCATRKTVDEVCANLCAAGLPAVRYHAGLSDEERQKNQDDFSYDRVRIIVATNAFGMGIDKSNVRFVIHYNMPKDLESYYQEAGRAGRDGERADCILLYSPRDVQIQRFLLEQEPDNPALSAADRAQVRKTAMQRLRRMEAYCQTTDCLRANILHYFGQEAPETCGLCSSCLHANPLQDMSRLALPILRAVEATGQRYGLTQILDMLRGSKRESIRLRRLDENDFYGVLSGVNRATLREVANQLVARDYLTLTDSGYPVAKLGPAARRALLEGGGILLKMPVIADDLEETEAADMKPDNAPVHVPDDGLFEALRSLRLRLAMQQGIPAFMIFSDATLRDMARLRPLTRAAMQRVKGVGEAKLNRYGEQFLACITKHCRLHEQA